MKRVLVWVLGLLVVTAGVLGGLAWYMFYGGGADIPPDLLVEVAEEPPSEAELSAAVDRLLAAGRDRADDDARAQAGAAAEARPGSGPAEQAGTDPAPQAVTEESILREYLPQFMHLERRANASLDRVLQAAVRDHRAMEKAGTGGKRDLAAKYLTTIRQLEDVTGHEFDALADRMRGDLRAASLPLGVVKKAEQEYKDRKRERREALMEKALDMI